MNDKKKQPADKSKPKAKGDEKKKKVPNAVLMKIKKQQEEQNKIDEEKQRQEEEEERKLREHEAQLEKERQLKLLKKEKMKQKKKEKKERDKKEGTYINERDRKKLREKREKLLANQSDDAQDILNIDNGGQLSQEKDKKNVKEEKCDNVKSELVEDVIETVEDEESAKNEEDEDDELGDWDATTDEESDRDDTEKVTERAPETKKKHENVSDIICDDPIESVRLKLQMLHKQFESNRNESILRSPIVCVLGHVDTGKTKILDKLRHTDVQGGECGGITQQIGATNIPIDHIPRVKELLPDLKLPGLLIIDTPGHESFSNMRSRGSNLCDIAVLVVDIMHGVEAQTKESIKLLKKRRVPFVIALNKIDRLIDWVTDPKKPIKSLLDLQKQNCKYQFQDRYKIVIQHFAELSINVRFFWEEDEQEDYISIVPTSAHTGDGMDDLIAYLCNYSQNKLSMRLSYTEELQASVMEVKETQGHGTTLDIILVNGCLKSNDLIVLGGQEGPISTKIRYLLKPAPMAELRVKGDYNKINECRAAQGVKLVAKDIDKAMPGMPVYRATNEDEVLYYKNELSSQIEQAIASIRLSDVGVYVQTSTIGSLEALLEFLKQQNVPYSGINIGTIHKKDVTRAAIMREKDPKWAVIMAFNVRIEPEAASMANDLGVKIFQREIIYHLHDDLTGYLEKLEQEVKERTKDRVVFPVMLKILPQHIIQKRNPILVGVRVERGVLRMGTPIVALPQIDGKSVELGKAMSIEMNHHSVSEARTGEEVCVRIDPVPGEPPRMLGRHFQADDPLYSKINRDSIDLLKKHYRNEMNNDDWKLIKDMKPLFNIM